MQNREYNDGDLVPGTRYRVIRLLGSGGMGTVYEVEHTELGKRFVLKALLRELSRRPDIVNRLRNEWRALGRLDHPNIVNVTDAGATSTGTPYYVMERLEGETLAARLRRVRRLPVPQALELAAQILDGLSAAHDIGVIHRDVKPPNIFLVQSDRAKILDFGVAKIADVANVQTARGVAVGTPRFMSPEQVRGRGVDGRSDLYAVGLVLFEVIAGVGPFDDAADANELLLAHDTREPPRLTSLVMGVLPEVDELVAALLSKDPSQRPESARSVALCLRAIADSYAQRVSSSSITEIANYTETTIETRFHTTQDVTTRPEGVALGRAARRSYEPLPSTTRAEPLSEQLTEVSDGFPGRPSPPADSGARSRAGSSVTSRLGSVDPQLIVAKFSGAPGALPSGLAPVVARAEDAPSRVRSVALGALVTFTAVLSGGVAWRAITAYSRPSADQAGSPRAQATEVRAAPASPPSLGSLAGARSASEVERAPLVARAPDPASGPGRVVPEPAKVEPASGATLPARPKASTRAHPVPSGAPTSSPALPGSGL